MDLAPDRLQKLLGQNSVTGIDFVYVHEDQTTLDVVFFQHDDTPQANDILGTVLTNQIRIYSPTGAEGLPDENKADERVLEAYLGGQYR
jgi:hypothetical protein